MSSNRLNKAYEDETLIGHIRAVCSKRRGAEHKNETSRRGRLPLSNPIHLSFPQVQANGRQTSCNWKLAD